MQKNDFPIESLSTCKRQTVLFGEASVAVNCMSIREIKQIKYKAWSNENAKARERTEKDFRCSIYRSRPHEARPQSHSDCGDENGQPGM